MSTFYKNILTQLTRHSIQFFKDCQPAFSDCDPRIPFWDKFATNFKKGAMVSI